MDPSLEGYLTFIYSIMAVPPSVLPSDSPVIRFSYDMALDVVLRALYCVWSMPTSPSIYAVAVYNFAANTLITYAPDIAGSEDPTFWSDLRKLYGLNSFTGGIINFSSDVSTSQGLAVPDALKNLMIGDLALLKTPYGRQYLAIAQSAGPGPWGIS